MSVAGVTAEHTKAIPEAEQRLSAALFETAVKLSKELQTAGEAQDAALAAQRAVHAEFVGHDVKDKEAIHHRADELDLLVRSFVLDPPPLLALSLPFTALHCICNVFSLPSLTYSLPLLAPSLPFTGEFLRPQFTAFACTITDFHCHSLPLLALSLPFAALHCLCLHYLFLSLPFTAFAMPFHCLSLPFHR